MSPSLVQVFILFSVTVSLLFEVLTLSLLKGMPCLVIPHIIFSARVFLVRVRYLDLCLPSTFANN